MTGTPTARSPAAIVSDDAEAKGPIPPETTPSAPAVVTADTDPAPNFFIAGVQKGGTTWLYAILRRHPQIFMPRRKELNFFNKHQAHLDANWADYLANFEPGRNARYRGEATPHYFWKKTPHSAFCGPYDKGSDPALNIASRLSPETRILVILRDPVSRAISGYHHHFAMRRNDAGNGVFRCPPGMGIVDLGFYRRHMLHWNEVFGERIKYVLFDDISEQPRRLLREITDWLDLPPLNPALVGRFIDVKVNDRREILARNDAGEGRRFPVVTAQEVQALLGLYRDHVMFVERTLGRELSHWRSLGKVLEANAHVIGTPWE